MPDEKEDEAMEAILREMSFHRRWFLIVLLGTLIPMWVSIILAILITR